MMEEKSCVSSWELNLCKNLTEKMKNVNVFFEHNGKTAKGSVNTKSLRDVLIQRDMLSVLNFKSTPEGEKVEGTAKPSSELDMHRIFYQKRPEIKAVVHTHSRYAVTLATMGKSIPPMHYLIAYSGREVPCTPYKTIGSYELAEAAYETMGDNYACLLGNHGLLACAGNISYAMDIAEQIEFVANIYYNTLLAGGPKMLKDEDIDVVLEAFKTYRQR